MTTAPQEAPITHRRVLAIALPIVVSNATVPILGIVDTGVVGQLGAAAPIGAVGIGATILTALYWVFGFLRMGTTGLVGQAAGRGDAAEVSALLTRALMIAAAGGLVLIALQSVLFAAALGVAPASARAGSGRLPSPSPSSASPAGSSRRSARARCWRYRWR